jgi:protein-tyrosine phosphatase
MLQLAELVEHPGIVSLYLPVEDFQPIPPNLLRQGIDFVQAQKHQEHRVLIACGAGINRSTAFAVATLREEEGLSLLDAFRAVKRVHSEAMPHPPIWASLCEYYQENIPFDKLLIISNR